MKIDNDNFDSLEKRIVRAASLKKAPVNGSLELIPLCNMNCTMCFVRLPAEEMKKQGRLRTPEEWIRIIQEMKEAGALLLLLTGGEPLLYKGFKEVYLAAKKAGMIVTINTNGTLINEEWIEFFAENKPRRINITIYGSSDETYEKLCGYPGGYSKVKKNIELLLARGIDVKGAVSVTRLNKDDLADIQKFGRDLNIPTFADNYMMAARRERLVSHAEKIRLTPEEYGQSYIESLKDAMTPEAFLKYVNITLNEIDSLENMPVDERKEFLQKNGRSRNGLSCLAGNCSFTINWQGKMRPCVVSSWPEADVFESGFQAAWERIVEECGKIRTSGKCFACPKKVLCRTCGIAEKIEEGEFGRAPEYLCRCTDEALMQLRKVKAVLDQQRTI